MFTIVLLSVLIAALLPFFQLPNLWLLSDCFPKLHPPRHFSLSSDDFCWDAGLSSEPVYSFQESLPFLHYPKLEVSELPLIPLPPLHLLLITETRSHFLWNVICICSLFHCHYICTSGLRFWNSLWICLPASTTCPSPHHPGHSQFILCTMTKFNEKIKVYRLLYYSEVFSAFLHPGKGFLNWGLRMGFRRFITCSTFFEIVQKT